MKHIVLFKFRENPGKDILSKTLSETYEKLEKQFNVIEGYDFKFNVLDKEANMDLILFVKLKSSDSLEEYIGHFEHKVFLEKFKALGLISKSVIDI